MKLKFPRISFPRIKFPSIKLPSIKLPSIKLPGIKLPGIKNPFAKVPSVQRGGEQIPLVKRGAESIPLGESRAEQIPFGTSPAERNPPENRPAEKIQFGTSLGEKNPTRKILPGKLRPGGVFAGLALRRVAIGLLGLAALGLAASFIVTVRPQLMYQLPAIDANAAFALMRVLPLASAGLGLLAGALCLISARALAAASAGRPTAGDALAPSELRDVVRELRTILADEQSKVSAFQEVCNANGREARSMTAHVARLSEASREAESRLAKGVERATAVLRQTTSGEVAPGGAGPHAERAPMDVSDVILRRITEQTRVIGLTLDGAVGRMAAETENSVQSFRTAVTDATAHIAALGNSAVALRRDVIALDTAGREIATAGATVISRVGGAVANVDAALIYLPAAAAAVQSAAALAGETLGEASTALRADSAAIEAWVRETREAADLLQRDAATAGAAKQEIVAAGHAAIASVAETVEAAVERTVEAAVARTVEAAVARSVEAALARLATATTEAEVAGARDGSATLADLTARLEQAAATLADDTAAGREMRLAVELVQREVVALGAARQEIADAGVSAGRIVETAAARLATVIADADGARQGSAEVAATLERAAASVTDASGVLRADGVASGQAMREAVELLRGEMADAKQEIADAGVRAGQTVETAAARLTAVIADADGMRQGSAEVAATLERAAASVTDASGVLRADGVASGQAMREAMELLRGEMGDARQEIADAGVRAGQTVETAAARLATVIADADGARQGSAEVAATLETAAAKLVNAAASVTDASGVLRADGVASGQALREAVELLRGEAGELPGRHAAAMSDAKQEIADAAASAGRIVETAAAGLAAVIADADGARRGSAEVAATLEQAAATLVTVALGMTKASDVLSADSALAGRDTREAAEMLQREAAAMAAVKQEIADAAQTVGLATARLAALLADAESAGQGSAGLAELTATLDNVTASLVGAASSVTEASGVLCADGAAMRASGHEIRQAAELLQRDAAVLGETATATVTLVDAAASLASAGQRIAAAGECAADQFAANLASSQAILASLPEVRAELTEAVSELRLETLVLSTAAQQISAAGAAATSAVSDVAVRAELAATSMGTAGRALDASSADAAVRIDRLGGVARQAETQISRLPGVAAELGAAADRLRDMTEASDALRGILPDAAARIEAAAPGLDRLDALSRRLETAATGLPAAAAREASMMTLMSLSADIGEAVSRVEAALSAHDGVWPAVAASMAQVEAAVAALARAAADQSAAPAAADGTPAALAATLRRLDDVTAQTEMLLRQTEALAEAVIEGRAPGLAVLLADRTPGLLAGIDSMTRRLRSVATALALVNDGVPALEHASRRAG